MEDRDFVNLNNEQKSIIFKAEIESGEYIFLNKLFNEINNSFYQKNSNFLVTYGAFISFFKWINKNDLWHTFDLISLTSCLSFLNGVKEVVVELLYPFLAKTELNINARWDYVISLIYLNYDFNHEKHEDLNLDAKLKRWHKGKLTILQTRELHDKIADLQEYFLKNEYWSSVVTLDGDPKKIRFNEKNVMQIRNFMFHSESITEIINYKENFSTLKDGENKMSLVGLIEQNESLSPHIFHLNKKIWLVLKKEIKEVIS